MKVTLWCINSLLHYYIITILFDITCGLTADCLDARITLVLKTERNALIVKYYTHRKGKGIKVVAYSYVGRRARR